MFLAAKVPRVQCPKHRVLQLAVPWSEGHTRLTALCEAMVIDWLQHATIAAVAQQIRLTWDEVDGVMQRAVQRGLRRRDVQLRDGFGVDETFVVRTEDGLVVKRRRGTLSADNPAHPPRPADTEDRVIGRVA